MFQVQVEKTIACAHQLVGYDGPCENLHGHNYRIVVQYKGEGIDECGMLVDFGDIKTRFNEVLAPLDHAFLNELAQFAGISPSAENIAKHVYVEMARTDFDRAKLDEVQVWETPTQMASYRQG